MPVRLLPDRLVNRIRAGEVVERPAQVVKELVENAIDAGADRLTIRVCGAGLDSVIVQDNGCGMTRDDLVLAIRRHTTSKIEDDDLANISTLGFRGEALAAIGAVGQLVISTRTATSDCGWQITVDHGAAMETRPCAMINGTRVELRGLFRQHPARLKSLSSPRSEAAAIRETVRNLALSRPSVGMILVENGRETLCFRPSTIDARALDVMGLEFASDCLAFARTVEGIEIKGFVSPPSRRMTGSPQQRFVIDGRPVRDQIVTAALKSAWADISPDEAPSAVVFLAPGQGAVDHNVHATKARIRLAAPERIRRLLVDAIRSATGSPGAGRDPDLAHAAVLAARGTENPPDHLARPLGTALGLIGSRYLIADTRKGLAIIDVHAAHERIIHERLKNRSAATNVDRRPISPVAVRLNALDTARVLDRREDLLRAGLDVDEAPDHEGVIVSGMPASLPGVDAISLVRAVASELAHDPLSDPLGSRLDRLSRTIACHAAFRTGDEITLERLDLMLREIEATPNAARCNHGRPTTISLTLDDLDRLFERS